MDVKEFVRIAEGSDTAVLMIHGIVGTPAHFKEFLPLLPEEWSVCNLLLDGHGKGVQEFGATSMTKWKTQVSDRLAELLKTHERVLIVAHSMGTLFAIRAAVEQPERIAGLFLLSVPLRVHLPPRTIHAAVKNASGLVKPGDKAAMDMKNGCGVELTPCLWKYLPWAARFAELLREISRVRKLLPRIAVPALAFHSSKDELVSSRALKDLEKHGHIAVSVLPESGHFWYEPQDLRLLQAELKAQILRIKKDRDLEVSG